MKPDKIYLNTPKVYANSSDSYECSTWATKEYDNCENTEYIRKDALLEWLKERYSSNMNLPHDIIQEPIMQGYMGAISDVINKLNSL